MRLSYSFYLEVLSIILSLCLLLIFGVSLCINTLFANRPVNFICRVDRQEDLTLTEIPLLESATYEGLILKLKSIGNQYSDPTTDPPTKMLTFYPKIKRHNVAFCEDYALSPITKVRIRVLAGISGLISTVRIHILETGRHIHLPMRSMRQFQNMLVKVFLINFSAVEKNLPKRMVLICAINCPVIPLVITNLVAAKMCESPNQMVVEAAAGSVRLPQNEIIKLSFVALCWKTQCSVFSNE